VIGVSWRHRLYRAGTNPGLRPALDERRAPRHLRNRSRLWPPRRERPLRRPASPRMGVPALARGWLTPGAAPSLGATALSAFCSAAGSHPLPGRPLLRRDPTAPCTTGAAPSSHGGRPSSRSLRSSHRHPGARSEWRPGSREAGGRADDGIRGIGLSAWAPEGRRMRSRGPAGSRLRSSLVAGPGSRPEPARCICRVRCGRSGGNPQRRPARSQPA
jgi:hypothetical protein